ncbi:pilus assembly protein TadG-related protein [Phenylobacterium sp.]|uniref:pilus assembly protein TadG-related protein n=1 Tax=Phenylobacterium sp. TaxID=1871053 RepID=UPI0035B2C587
MSGRRPSASSLWADERGAAGLVFAFSLLVLLGFAGLGLDAGVGYVARRSAQHAADSAAFSAAAARLAASGAPAAEARLIASAYGYTQGEGGDTVVVNLPATSGPFAGDARSAEVIITRPAQRFFSVFWGQGGRVIRARAVARAGVIGNACVVALHETAAASALETGTADVNLSGCSLHANSNSPTALELKGAATLRADRVSVVGGYSVSNNAVLQVDNGLHSGQAPIADPYRDVPIPAYSGCDAKPAFSGVVSVSNTSGVKVFCNGLSINAGAKVTFAPGIYIIDRGDFSVNSGASIHAHGVTFVLTSSTGSNYATFHTNGQAEIDIIAPSSGPTAGLAFYQDRRAPSGGDNRFNGGSSQKITGAVYFPSQSVIFTGGSATAVGACTQILASQVTLSGNSNIQLNCEGVGVRAAGGVATALVE